MSYGWRSLDFVKSMVLLSSLFNVIMPTWVFLDPEGVINSEHAGGWWDSLKGAGAQGHCLVRMYAVSSIMILVVRMNWVFTNETSPSLYRATLFSYLLPISHFLVESLYFKTIQQSSPMPLLILVVTWILLLTRYSKYTQEPDSSTKKEN